MPGGLLCVWALLPVFQPHAANKRASSLLAVVARTYNQTQSISAEIEQIETDASGRTGDRRGRILVKRPNFACVRFDSEKAAVLNSDGRTIRMPGSPDRPADPEGQNIRFSIPVSLFFGQPVLKSFPYGLAHPRYAGRERFGGTECDVISLALPKPIYQEVRLYIGPDRLVRRQVTRSTARGALGTLFDERLTRIQLNKYIPLNAFMPREPKRRTGPRSGPGT